MKRLLVFLTLMFVGLLGACDATGETPTTFEVFFDAQGGSAIDSVTVELAEPVAMPDDPVRSDFEFAGWYLDETVTIPYDFINPIVSDLTLYAKWIPLEDDPNETIDPVTITFDSMGGTMVNAMTANPGTSIGPPAEPVKTDFVFGGWYESTDFQTPFSFDDMPDADITLYAKWIPIEVEVVTISFDTNGGSIINAIVAVPGDPIGLPAEPTKTDFVFGGWYIDAALTTIYDIPTTMPQDDVTVYAKWIDPIELVYTITYESNDGTYIEPTTQSKSQTPSAPSEPVKEGYLFDGWFLDESLTTRYEFNNEPTEDFTLYAGWTIDDANLVRIHFETNGGTPIDDVLLEPGTAYNLPNTTYKDGHLFLGWYSDANLTRAFYGATFRDAGTYTYYAKWEAADDIVVFTFESNGGSAVHWIPARSGYMITPPEDPIRTGYTFDGWYTDVALNNAYYLWYTYSDITLYAKWIEQTNSNEIVESTLIETLEGFDFLCTGTICEAEVASGFVYRVHVDTGLFVYDKHTVEEGDAGYRYYDSVITIDSDWDVSYTYEVDENFGVQINTELTLVGNVLTDQYTVTFFDSNVTTEASREAAALQSIGYFATFVESLLEAAGITMDVF